MSIRIKKVRPEWAAAHLDGPHPARPPHPPFFAHLFKSIAYIQALRSTTNLIRDGQDLRYSHFVQIDLPVIPLQEQEAIASFLNRETAKIDSLISESQRAIDLLQERRTALISAAVTGQIDVRNLPSSITLSTEDGPSAPEPNNITISESERPKARLHTSPGHGPGKTATDDSPALKGRITSFDSNHITPK